MAAVTGTLVAGAAVASVNATSSSALDGGVSASPASAQALLLSAGQPSLSQDVASSVGKARAEYRKQVRAQAAAQRKAEEQARREAEQAAAAAASAPTTNGIADSVYSGSYYNAAYDSTRRCIVQRESGGDYGISSSNGMWHGAYQFALDTSNVAAQQMGRPDLVGVTANNWSRHDQDQAFWVMWNNGAGAAHWGGHC